MTPSPVRATSRLVFDIREIPFSYRGSWLNLSRVTGLRTSGSDIHLVSHTNGMHAVLTMEPIADGAPVEATWHAEPGSFRWTTGDGASVAAAFDGPTVLRIRGRGLGLRLRDAAPGLTPFTGDYLFTDPVDGATVLTSYETGRRYRVTRITGAFDVVGEEALGVAERAVVAGGNGGDWELAIEETTASSPSFIPATTFDSVVERAEAAFTDYLDLLAPWRDDRTPASALAAYVLWSATVSPSGFLTRESVLMSKHWMDKVWSWDHCFNALALAPGLPDEALDQFLAPFDYQDVTGALPDSVTHSEVLYNYVKPPIHGWTLRRFRATAGRDLDQRELSLVFDKLAAWSLFWLERRRRPDHTLPYYQHGNDSGWDNATTFDLDRVIEAPDLAAFLVLQLETLADLAVELGRPDERWRKERDELLAALLEQLWHDGGFVAVGALSGRRSTSTSLLALMPIVLGDRLPPSVLDALASRLADHLTAFGLATEPVTSSQYESDGYWRGPIWAPSTALLEDGLRRAGYTDLADSVSDRFLALCERSGFAENFDARTGAGLRDRAYTWTAAVYLMFGAQLGDAADVRPDTVPEGARRAVRPGQ